MIKVCPICGKEFETKHKYQVYCSHTCTGIAQRKYETLICDYCGKEFYKPDSQIKMYEKHFCSNECRFLASRIQDKIYRCCR